MNERQLSSESNESSDGTPSPRLPIGDELAALVVFRAVAARIKAAEAEMRAASQAYGEAIKALSEASTK